MRKRQHIGQATILLGLAVFLFGFAPGPVFASEVKRHETVFASVDGQSLSIDLFVPDATEAPPLVVFIHGGGWKGGSRRSCPIRFLCDYGFAVASVDYRLAPDAVFPDQIHDCKGAIRWLRHHGDQYGYRVDRIAVAGTSAGGTLALLVGTSGDVPELEGDVGGHADVSSRVQAVIDYYGPSDLPLRARTQPGRSEVPGVGTYLLLGGAVADKPDQARMASPVTHVSADDPPLLVMHGDQDEVVLIDQSERIVQVYRQHGLDVEYEALAGAGHGGSPFLDAERSRRLVDFLRKHLMSPTGEDR